MSHHTETTDSLSLIQSVLHTIAQDVALADALTAILSSAMQLTNAQAGFFIIFTDTPTLVTQSLDPSLVPDSAHLRQRTSSLGVGQHVSSHIPLTDETLFAGCLLSPIYVKKKAWGLLCLLFETDYATAEQANDWLQMLIDSLTIVTLNAQFKAQQYRLARNQHEFVRIVAHDLRSPLSSMLGFASMLESTSVGDLNEKQLYFVQKIVSGIDQMTALVDNIQDAGRYDPETGFYEMERHPIDLRDMVNEIVANQLMPADKENLEMVVVSAEDIPIISGDVTMLTRGITNLVENAIKYTPDGGKIEVGVTQDGDSLVIAVQDNGYGISEEDQKRLFERHFRIRRREHKRVKGSGLGLFIVRSVAQRHGGDAWVESTEGKGSTFFIRIPLAGDNLLGANDPA